jgi:hypothetical protein
MLALTLSLAFLVPAFAFAEVSLDKLRNDKEVVISSFGSSDRSGILNRFSDQDLRDKVKSVFSSTLKRFLESDVSKCELYLIDEFRKDLKNAELANDEKSIESYLKLVRISNIIDDIFYDILSSNNRDYFAFKSVKLTGRAGNVASKYKLLYEKNDLKELYSNFEPFPDEVNQCAYQEFIFLKNNIVDEEGLRPDRPLRLMSFLNKKALREKLITLATFHKLEFLRKKSELKKRYILMRDYFKIVSSAKDQMVPVNRVYKPFTLDKEDKFSSERMKRFSKLTRRKLLYRKYDETQIILLAQILQKASRRMGVDVDTKSEVPYITQSFEVTERNGERRTYVERLDLDPQSQFNLARRLMRKDMVEMQMMDTFNKLQITHQDIVMAAFETGYITIEDISYVVRYDDLWNPETSKFERISGFVFKVSGYATFFLPTPWNIVGTIALGVVEGIVDKKNSTGADNDNPATFIE